jgi:hypothetical protein
MFHIVLGVTVHRFYFLCGREMEQTNHEAPVTKLSSYIRKLTRHGAVIMNVVSDSASHLERVLGPDQLHESLS